MTDTPPPLAMSADADTESAGQRVDEGKGRMFPCEGCGADFHFHIGQQTLKCPFCGFEKELEISSEAEVAEQDLQATLQRLVEQRQEREGGSDAAESAVQEIRCDACGAEVQFTGTLTSTQCAYCDSPIQIDAARQSESKIPVDGVLPFQVGKEKARGNLNQWVKSRWFAPNEFKKRGAQGKFTGVYLPYWTYDTMTFNAYSGQRGEYYYVTVGSGKDQRRERRTRWYPASGSFQRFFDDVLVAATRGLSRKLLRKLEPWPLQATLPYNQQVLAGYQARSYDVELATGFKIAEERIDAAIRSEVRSRIGGDTQRIHSINTRHDAMTYKHLLLPTWLLAYRFRDKVYQVLINAATGEVQGERPWSWVKILFAALGGLVVLGGGALVYKNFG